MTYQRILIRKYDSRLAAEADVPTQEWIAMSKALEAGTYDPGGRLVSVLRAQGLLGGYVLFVEIEGTPAMPYAEAYSYLKARVPSEAKALESRSRDKPILGYFVVDLGEANPTYVDDHGDVFPERVMLCLHPPGASPDGDGLWVEVAGEESGTPIYAAEKVTGPAVLDRMLGFFVGEIARLRGKT